MRQILGSILVAALVTLASASAVSADGAAQEAAYGTGSVLTTLVYAPVKASFCILGGVTSAFTLPFAGPQTAEQVVSGACGGTWAITPDALKGQERVRFVGGGSGDQTTTSRTATRR
jgi:hypothetical protein